MLLCKNKLLASKDFQDLAARILGPVRFGLQEHGLHTPGIPGQKGSLLGLDPSSDPLWPSSDPLWVAQHTGAAGVQIHDSTGRCPWNHVHSQSMAQSLASTVRTRTRGGASLHACREASTDWPAPWSEDTKRRICHAAESGIQRENAWTLLCSPRKRH